VLAIFISSLLLVGRLAVLACAVVATIASGVPARSGMLGENYKQLIYMNIFTIFEKIRRKPGKSAWCAISDKIIPLDKNL
jgi:hypothetical protein